MDGIDLWRMADLATPMAIRVAATLRIADHLARTDMSAEQLARSVATDVEALRRLLAHLVSIGVLSQDELGRFALTPAGECLRDDHESGMRGTLDIEGALGRAELSFVHLLHSVRAGEASFLLLYGRTFWDDLGEDVDRSADYDAQMGTDVKRWAEHLVGAYDWGTLGLLVDVGGGDGTLIEAILRRYSSLRGIVFDQPTTVERARAALAAAGLDDRAEAIAGSFFDPLPAGAGGYLLSAILHDCNDESAAAILRRCAEAAGSGGRVLVVEKTGVGGESPSTAMDLRLLVYFGGRERGVAALTALADRANLVVEAVHPAGELSIIELRTC